MTKGDGKPCKKCGTSEWYRGGSCKECTRRAGKRRYEENKELIIEQSREWAKNNPDKRREINRNWSRRNKKYRAEYSRKWRLENPDKARERTYKWRRENPQRDREISRRSRKKNKRKRAHYQRKRNARKQSAEGSHTYYEWTQVIKKQGGKCLRCGKETKLTPDHIIPFSQGGSDRIENIQGLCQPCNSSKGNRHTTDYRTDSGTPRWIQNRLID